MARPTKEYQAFRNLTDRLLQVPKAVVDERIAAYKAERAAIPSELKPGPNPKRKRGGRASGV
jgi:hypothetical protein